MAIVQVAENNTYTVEKLYQWDKGQTLEVYGLSLPSVPELRFAHKGADRSIVRVASMDAAGVIRAEIPNSLLQKAYTIQVYIGLYEGKTFRTHYKLEIPVRAQAKPLDYTLEDDPEVYSFEQLEAQVIGMEQKVAAQTAAVDQKVAQALAKANTATTAANTAAAAAESAAEELARAEEMLASAVIVTLTHALNGTVHELTGLGSAEGLVNAQFKATDAITEGDLVTVDGVPYAARMTNGIAPDTDFWVAGATISCIIDTEDQIVNFKGGGGVELPALTNPAGAAQILNGYQAVDGEGLLLEGTAGKGITKPATAAKITTGFQAMLADGTILTGTNGAIYAVKTGTIVAGTAGASSAAMPSGTVTVSGNIYAVLANCSNGNTWGGVAEAGVQVCLIKYFGGDAGVSRDDFVISFSGKVFTYDGSRYSGVSGDTITYHIIYKA